jgi:hypothetical protein
VFWLLTVTLKATFDELLLFNLVRTTLDVAGPDFTPTEISLDKSKRVSLIKKVFTADVIYIIYT